MAGLARPPPARLERADARPRATAEPGHWPPLGNSSPARVSCACSDRVPGSWCRDSTLGVSHGRGSAAPRARAGCDRRHHPGGTRGRRPVGRGVRRLAGTVGEACRQGQARRRGGPRPRRRDRRAVLKMSPMGSRPAGPRFRLRTLMVAVAVAAVPLALLAVSGSRRQRFRRLAAEYDSRVVGIHAVWAEGKKYRYFHINPSSAASTPATRILQERRDLWNINLCINYRAAAEHPLWPVPPDPPRPE